MTPEEFDNTQWGSGMFAMYRGKKYPIVSVDFHEGTVALDGVTQGQEEPTWVLCENITLVDD